MKTHFYLQPDTPLYVSLLKMQGMNNNGVDKEDKEEKAGLTLEQFTDIVLAQVSFHGMAYFHSDQKIRTAYFNSDILGRNK